MKTRGKALFFVFNFSFFTVCPAQIITTIAGNGVGGFSGNGGPATAAEIGSACIAFDIIGNLYISDGDISIRKVNTSGIINAFAGNGFHGYSGDGGPATAAELNFPEGLASDDIGNIYIADWGNNVIRKINTAGIISTFAGNGYYPLGGTGGYSGDGGPATAAELDRPADVSVDKLGNLYIADARNNVVRKVNTSGIISTFAGNGYGAGSMGGGGFSGDGGPASSAEFYGLGSVAVDNSGNVYIADGGNHRVRIVNLSGVINTFAGDTDAGYSGDGGPATAAEIYPPVYVRVNDSGVYIAFIDNIIRKVNTSGIISTFVGNGINGFFGDGGPATAAELYNAISVALDTSGNLYIADQWNNRIRKVSVVLSVLANSITNVSCNGASNGSATISVSEGLMPYTYSWSNGATGSTVTNLSAGTYTVNMIDSESVTGSTIVVITEPPALGISTSVIANVSCNGGNNGSALSSVSGGTVPYTYIWSDASSQTTVTTTGLVAGTYTLTATDNNGCTASAIISISQPSAIIPSILEYAGIKCNGDSDAALFVDATGGSGFYAYSWSDASSQATALATGLSVGNYTVIVTDNNGCSGTSSTTITQPSLLNVVADSINEIGGSCNGSAWVIVTGGTPLYTYLWTGGLTTDTITNQCEGSYCSTVTDATGCMDSVCVNIDVSTGINNIINSPEIIIYPNPTSSNFTVELSNINGACNLELFNILGKKISSTELKTNTTNIDMSSEAEGVYLYRFIDKGGITIETGKIVVLR